MKALMPCGLRFLEASASLDNYVKDKEVRKDLEKMNVVVLTSLPDILFGNTQKINDKLQKFGSLGFKNATEQSTDPEQKKLFEELKSVDDGALKQTSALKNGDTRNLVIILCKMFGEKVKLIDDYIEKQQNSNNAKATTAHAATAVTTASTATTTKP